MKRTILFLLVMNIAVGVLGQLDYTELKKAALNLSGEELFGYVEELANEKYQGRLTGSPEYLEVANYLAEYFEDMGLMPGYKGEWFQWFDQAYTVVKPGCRLELLVPVNRHDTIRKAYHYFDQYMPGSTSGNGTVEAEVVFVGWGISAPELGFDEYKGVDVKGKIVLMRPEAPVLPGAGAEFFLPWLPYSLHQYKMQNAIDHGAVGLLYHYGPLANTNNDYHENLINSLVGTDVVEDLFSGTGKDYSELVKKIQDELKPYSFSMNKIVAMQNHTEYHPEGKGNSVIALLPGSDPELRNEVVIIGGHLDHVGACYEVCPGAQDNASGIAVIMGIAKLLKESGVQLKRSVLFMGLGAEEQGLVGSKEYIESPAFPLSKTFCYLNLDCVGVGPNLHAGGGENFPGIFAAVKRANNRLVHRQLSTSFNANLGRPRSDAAVFMKAGIPSLSFSSGGGKGYYHVPLDDVNTIWPETMEDLAVMLSFAVAEMANRIEKPVRGPEKGHLIIAGGALRDSTGFARFVELAGGENAKIVIVPTAGEDRSLNREGYFDLLSKTFARYGVEECVVLHTRDPKEADSTEFYKPLLEANAVWFNGGRQWRLADSYLNTKTHKAFEGVLERGGVIGGSSAGATIQGTYLFRGDTKTNTILCGDHEDGLGFMSNVAIDQHLLARNRQFDLFEALEKYPGVLGIGLDENTAIEVQGDTLKVLGQHYVLIYDGKFYSGDRRAYVNQTRGAYPFYLLKPGQEYDLKNRAIIVPGR
ncbi:MAG: M28 family peptidase [Bacteroidetes bacterium]|nr:M28 family peptidase [Bacteroidota bacterium]